MLCTACVDGHLTNKEKVGDSSQFLLRDKIIFGGAYSRLTKRILSRVLVKIKINCRIKQVVF